MAKRTFGGRSVADLKKLRRNPADGGVFYLALLDAAPDLFQLPEDFETLEIFVQSLVEKIEAAADASATNEQRTEALQTLKESLDDAEIRKIIASG